jgi:hypothetical protein
MHVSRVFSGIQDRQSQEDDGDSESGSSVPSDVECFIELYAALRSGGIRGHGHQHAATCSGFQL